MLSRRYSDSCVREYTRYSDTVAVLLAIRHLLIKRSDIAKFIGVEYQLRNLDGTYVKPDLVAQYEENRKGMLFEVKWSLPFDEEYLKKELKELGKYSSTFKNWKTSNGLVTKHDIVLVCQLEDAKRAIEMATELKNDTECAFMYRQGFSIWGWVLSPGRGSRHKEELRLLPCYGSSDNSKIENMLRQTGGILVTEDILTHLRFTFAFIPEKPPVQYTIAILIQNIFPSFRRSTEKEVCELDLDLIYERAKSFFPSWAEFDTNNVQTKRKWLSEAIEKMCDIGLAGRMPHSSDRWSVPIPTLHPRHSIEDSICRKIARDEIKRRRSGRTISLVPVAFKTTKPDKSQTRIDKF